MSAAEYKTLVRKYFLWTTILCLLVPALFIACFYLLDPLQFFHRAARLDGPISGDMRAQAAGILNTFDIDSIILGTSHLENTSASEASAKLGGKFFNISIAGGDYAERALILNHALQKKRKNVLISLDLYYTGCPQRIDRMPTYLYDKNPFNDFRYYATLPNIKNLFREDRGLTQTDHDRPTGWFRDLEQMNRFGGIENWTAQKENPEVRGFLLQQLPRAAKTFASNVRKEVHNREKEKKAKEYLEKYLLEITKGHDETNFFFIFPPYTRFYYANMRRNNAPDYFLHQEIVRYLVDRTKEQKNIHIFGFEDQDFLDDIANHKDATHFHPKFNSMFLDAIAAGRHELTPENVEDYLKRCEQKAWDYDIPALNDEVQRLLQAAEAKEKD